MKGDRWLEPALCLGQRPRSDSSPGQRDSGQSRFVVDTTLQSPCPPHAQSSVSAAFPQPQAVTPPRCAVKREGVGWTPWPAEGEDSLP